MEITVALSETKEWDLNSEDSKSTAAIAWAAKMDNNGLTLLSWAANSFEGL